MLDISASFICWRNKMACFFFKTQRNTCLDSLRKLPYTDLDICSIVNTIYIDWLLQTQIFLIRMIFSFLSLLFSSCTSCFSFVCSLWKLNWWIFHFVPFLFPSTEYFQENICTCIYTYIYIFVYISISSYQCSPICGYLNLEIRDMDRW